MNQVILIGNVGAAVYRVTPQGVPCMDIRMATNQPPRRDSDEAPPADWHNVCIFGKGAEVAQDKLKVGCELFVRGHLRHYLNKQDPYRGRQERTVVIAEHFSIINPPKTKVPYGESE